MLMETQRVGGEKSKANNFTIDISSKSTTAAATSQEGLTIQNGLLRKSVAKQSGYNPSPGSHHNGSSMQQYSNNLMHGKHMLNERGSNNSQTRTLPSSRMPATVHPTHRPQNSTKQQFPQTALLDQSSGSPKVFGSGKNHSHQMSIQQP